MKKKKKKGARKEQVCGVGPPPHPVDKGLGDLVILAARIRLPFLPRQCTLRLERLRDKAQRVAVRQSIIQFESELQAVEEVGVVREAATPLLAVLCSSFFFQASEEAGEESCCTYPHPPVDPRFSRGALYPALLATPGALADWQGGLMASLLYRRWGRLEHGVSHAGEKPAEAELRPDDLPDHGHHPGVGEQQLHDPVKLGAVEQQAVLLPAAALPDRPAISRLAVGGPRPGETFAVGHELAPRARHLRLRSTQGSGPGLACGVCRRRSW